MNFALLKRMFSFYFVLSVFVVCHSHATFVGRPEIPLGKGGLPLEIPAMITSTWSDKYVVSHHQWHRNVDGRYEPFFNVPQVLKKMEVDGCNDLLAASQIPPLKEMLQANYISRAQKLMLIKLHKRLHPQQFRFYEVIEAYPEGYKGPFNLANGDLTFNSLATLGDRALKTKATLWSVSGQVTTPDVLVKYTKMPWQLDEEFKDVELDRSEYPFVWEMGRAFVDKKSVAIADAEMADENSAAGQNQKRLFDEMVSNAILGMGHELIARGRPLEDGHVFVHSLGPLQNRLFKSRRHPVTGERAFQVFAAHPDGNYNEVLVAKLTDLLAILPPESISKQIYDLVQLMPGRLDWRGAAEILFETKGASGRMLDVIQAGSVQPHPLMIRDNTEYVGFPVGAKAKQLGVYFENRILPDHLNKITQHELDIFGSAIVDRLVPGLADFAPHRQVAISNILLSDVQNNSQYIKMILMATYFYYEKHYAKAIQDLGSSIGPVRAADILRRLDFAIHSSAVQVGDQAKKIPGARAVPLRWARVKSMLEVSGVNLRVDSNYEFVGLPAFVFNGQDILTLIQQNPALASEARNMLRKRNWELIRMSHEAVGF